jgi:hypothetical protein
VDVQHERGLTVPPERVSFTSVERLDLDDRERVLDVVGREHRDDSCPRRGRVVDEIAHVEVGLELERAEGAVFALQPT